MNINRYPMLHIYAQKSSHSPARIAGNTAGLMALTKALIEATSIAANSSTELYWIDGESFDVQVIRDDTDNAWSSWDLPDQNVQGNNSKDNHAQNYTRKLERIVQEFRDTLEEIAQGLEEAIIEVAGEDCCWENWSEGRRGLQPTFSILADSIAELALLRESANSALQSTTHAQSLLGYERGMKMPIVDQLTPDIGFSCVNDISVIVPTGARNTNHEPACSSTVCH